MEQDLLNCNQKKFLFWNKRNFCITPVKGLWGHITIPRIIIWFTHGYSQGDKTFQILSNVSEKIIYETFFNSRAPSGFWKCDDTYVIVQRSAASYTSSCNHICQHHLHNIVERLKNNRRSCSHIPLCSEKKDQNSICLWTDCVLKYQIFKTVNESHHTKF